MAVLLARAQAGDVRGDHGGRRARGRGEWRLAIAGRRLLHEGRDLTTPHPSLLLHLTPPHSAPPFPSSTPHPTLLLASSAPPPPHSPSAHALLSPSAHALLSSAPQSIPSSTPQVLVSSLSNSVQRRIHAAFEQVGSIRLQPPHIPLQPGHIGLRPGPHALAAWSTYACRSSCLPRSSTFPRQTSSPGHCASARPSRRRRLGAPAHCPLASGAPRVAPQLPASPGPSWSRHSPATILPSCGAGYPRATQAPGRATQGPVGGWSEASVPPVQPHSRPVSPNRPPTRPAKPAPAPYKAHPARRPCPCRPSQSQPPATHPQAERGQPLLHHQVHCGGQERFLRTTREQQQQQQ